MRQVFPSHFSRQLTLISKFERQFSRVVRLNS
jgi:hypothetical protein